MKYQWKDGFSFSEDRGSITPVGIFGVVVSLALTLALANAAAAINQQRFLESVAQGIVLDAAGSRTANQPSPISISDTLNTVLNSLEVSSREIASRLAEAKVVSGMENNDGSVVAKICQPPRILFFNQVLVLGKALGLQVCASAAAINR